MLEVLGEGEELGTNEIARRCGINASTVSRLLATLAAARYVERVPESGRYRLSLRVVELGNAVLRRLDLRVLARPHLRMLVRLTGETATLSAPGDYDAITVDFEHGSAAVQSVAQFGRPSIGHATAVGKVLLAFGRVEAPRHPLEAFTAKTITSPERLADELDRVRRLGYADSREEREDGLSAVAAPVWDSSGELVAILGVQGPSWRFDARAMRDAATAVAEHAARLSAELGARSTP